MSNVFAHMAESLLNVRPVKATPKKKQYPPKDAPYGVGTGGGRPYEYPLSVYAKAAQMLGAGTSGRQVATLLEIKYDAVRNMQRRIHRGQLPYDPSGKFPKSTEEVNE